MIDTISAEHSRDWVGTMPSGVSTVGAPHDHEPMVEELKQKLDEARRREAATTEVLRVIQTSATNMQPVFDTIVRSAVALCDGRFSGVYRFDGELLHHVAHHNYTPEALEEVQRRFPARPTRAMGTGRAILERAVVHIPDVEADAEYRNQPLTRAVGMRSALFVPIIREGAPLGVIVVARAEPGPFSDDQIKLLKTFADQAMIAIENARLFGEVQTRTDELSESLEQQTATSEILSVISSSPGQLQPVFQSVLANAVRICAAKFGTLYLSEGNGFRAVAMHNAPPRYKEERKRGIVHPPPNSSSGRAARTKQVAQVVDIKAEQDYIEGDPFFLAAVELAGFRSVVSVPMLQRAIVMVLELVYEQDFLPCSFGFRPGRSAHQALQELRTGFMRHGLRWVIDLKEDELIGIISIHRQEVQAFTDKQIELLTSFAKQAVIAIENARLFEAEQASKRELQESLEYQTATSEVLSVISRSPSDLQPVLDVIVETAVRLCQADIADFRLLRDGLYHIAATTVNDPTRVNTLRDNPIAPGRSSVVGRVALERRTVHVPDIHTDPEYTYAPGPTVPGMRAILGVPLLRDGEVIGAIVLFNNIVKPFTPKQIALVTTFANQALIAIENARLF
jgi:GAF domain-containing protein